MAIAYGRCNSGHYFIGDRCPFDGWTSPQIVQLSRAAELLRQQDRPVTLENLRSVGVTNDALERCMVVEFGNPESAFDAAAIGEYIKGEARFDWAHLPPALK